MKKKFFFTELTSVTFTPDLVLTFISRTHIILNLNKFEFVCASTTKIYQLCPTLLTRYETNDLNPKF
ncbi:CLUMA_CG015551, isoform A [Clunio marinus]|uniref:CLUMA_CG015551, isoform A n=1 Tax=Clunio marinus TaxID=568069 RepID=A0A1J1IS34_9DIPT|nr:CLUMA_CG015551, isoform A [Clunio marinus]